MSGGTGPTEAATRRRLPTAVLACVAVLVVLIACGAAARGGPWASGAPSATSSHARAPLSGNASVPDTETSSPAPVKRGTGAGVSLAAYLVTALALAFVLLGLITVADLLRFPSRRRWRRQGGPSDAELEGVLAEPGDGPFPDAVQRALREIAEQPDAREAVVRAWLLLGEAAAEAGAARRPAESAREYARRLADTRRLPADSLERLATLYREARFSDHEMLPEQREVARRELFALQTALADAVDLAGFR